MARRGGDYSVDTTLSLSNSTQTLGDLTLDATAGRIAYNANATSLNMKSGAKITLHVKAGSALTLVMYSASYNTLEINGTRFKTASYTKFFSEATDVEIISYGDSYLKQIILENPKTAGNIILEGIEVSGYEKSEIAVGTALDLSKIIVTANYSDNSYEILDTTKYSVEHSVDINTAGTYEVVVTLNSDTSKKTTFNLTYVSEINDTLTSSVGYTFKGSTYTNSDIDVINANSSSTITLTTALSKYEHVTFTGCESNGNDNWLKFNKDATIKFSVGSACTLRIAFYNGSNNASVTLGETTVTTKTSSDSATYQTMYEYEITDTGEVCITSTANGYIGYFEIIFD